MSNYLIGVAGGIACYKTVTLCRLLMKSGHDVRVIMTDNACRFVTPLTFEAITRNRVYTSEFEAGLDAGMIEHIDLAGWADEFIIAPATANTVAKAACGIADNLLLSTILVYQKPVIFVPSMNVDMFADVTTQNNLKTLAERGHVIMEPASGEMACKAEGKGRMPEPEEIFSFVTSEKLLKGLKILVTAGPTAESIDPVRYISNRSSGKMGAAIAKKAREMGADVVLVAGPVSIPLDGLNPVRVQTASQMLDAVKERIEDADILVMAAAVADYRPKKYSDKKIKKSDSSMTIELELNPDILHTLSGMKRDNQVFCGFAAESNDLRENALKKLTAKKLDMIAANDISRSDIGFETDENEISLFFADGSSSQSGKVSKSAVAEMILTEALRIFKGKNGSV
jgi:phosphopantothenoylcysteine decarboxylase/phosphopantothenate--cysteine ligase